MPLHLRLTTAICCALALFIFPCVIALAQNPQYTEAGTAGGSNNNSLSFNGVDVVAKGNTLIFIKNGMQISKLKYKKKIKNIAGPTAGPPPCIVVTTKEGLFTVDVTDPANPKQLDEKQITDGANTVKINTKTAVFGQALAGVTYSTDGFMLLNVTTPTQITEVGQVALGGVVYDACPLGMNYFVAACGSAGVIPLWASTAWGVQADPPYPTNYAQGVCYTNNILCVADYFGNGNLKTLDTHFDMVGATFMPRGSLTLFGTPCQVTPMFPGGGGFPLKSPGSSKSGNLSANKTTSPTQLVLVAAQYGGMHIVNVTPTTPTLIKTITPPNSTNVTQVSTDGTSVALLSLSSGDCARYDIHDVNNPVLQQTYIGCSAVDASVIGTTLFLAGKFGGGLQAFDLTTLPDPAYLGRTILGAPSVLYPLSSTTILAGGSGMDVYDVTNPAAPTRRSHTSGATFVSGLAVKDHYAILVGSGFPNDIHVYDITNLNAPASMSAYKTPITGVSASDIVVSGNYAFASIGPPGLAVYDISNMTSLTLVTTAKPPDTGVYGGFALGVALQGNLLGLADSGNGFHLYDISNPASPKLLGSDSSIVANTLSFAGKLLYVTGGDAMLVYDISDPAHPLQVGSVSLPDLGLRIRQTGDKILVATGDGGASILERHNAASDWSEYW